MLTLSLSQNGAGGVLMVHSECQAWLSGTVWLKFPSMVIINTICRFPSASDPIWSARSPNCGKYRDDGDRADLHPSKHGSSVMGLLIPGCGDVSRMPPLHQNTLHIHAVVSNTSWNTALAEKDESYISIQKNCTVYTYGTEYLQWAILPLLQNEQFWFKLLWRVPTLQFPELFIFDCSQHCHVGFPLWHMTGQCQDTATMWVEADLEISTQKLATQATLGNIYTTVTLQSQASTHPAWQME